MEGKKRQRRTRGRGSEAGLALDGALGQGRCDKAGTRLIPVVISFAAVEQWLRPRSAPSTFRLALSTCAGFPGMHEWKA